MALQSDHNYGDRMASLAGTPVRLLFTILEPPLAALQRGLGIKRMPWIFLLPNLAFFGLFVIVPLFINFFYSLTGGTQLYLDDRPFVGTEQYSFLLDCQTYADPQTCREDRFWKGVYNTSIFIIFQVSFMVLFSLITALILNRETRRAAFSRGFLLSGVAFAGGCRADLEMDPAARRHSECFSCVHRAGQNSVLRQPRMVDVLGGLCLDLGAYGLLHPDPAGRTAGYPAGSVRGRRNGWHEQGAGVLADHPAASLAQYAGGDRAGADQGRADFSTRCSC